MNPVATFLNGLTSRRAAMILGCASVGLVTGIVAGVIQYSRQKPVYESRALIVPARDSLADGPAAWMKQEAAALLQQENLEEAARRIQMDYQHGIDAARCAALLGNAVSISIKPVEEGPPEISDRTSGGVPYQALQIVMRGENPQECSAAVSAIIGVRESAWLNAERQRVAGDPQQQIWRDRCAELEQLRSQSQKLRAELVAALPGSGIHRTALSDSALSSLNLTPLQSRLQADWNESRQKVERLTAEIAALPQAQLRPYAEFLEKPRASVYAVGPLWSEHGWTWTLGGAATGLAAGILLYLGSSRRSAPETHSGPPALAEF